MLYNSNYVSAPSISGYTISGSSQQYVTVGSGTREQTVTFTYRSNRPTSVTVTVRYEDEYSNRIKSSEYVEMSSSGYVYAPTIDGYTLTSGSSSYVTVSGGSASPSTVTFRYRKINVPTSATVTIRYEDEYSNRIKSSETVTLSSSGYVYAPTINGYTLTSNSSSYVTVSGGSASPSTVTFRYRKINVPTSATVTIRYEDEFSNRIKSSETVTLSSSGYVYAPTINGYTLTSNSSSYVTVSGGSASPSTVTFRYKKKSDSDSKASSADQILSRSKRSSRATYQRYQEGTQSLSNSSFSNLQDGSSYSSWYHTIWKSERTDNVADLTMYFSGSSVRWIWIRGGDSSSSYYDNARPRLVEVKVYGDRTVSTSITMTDSYYAGVDGYQCIDLGSTVTGVTRVEFYFRDYYQGSVNKYKMAVRDIIMN